MKANSSRRNASNWWRQKGQRPRSLRVWRPQLAKHYLLTLSYRFCHNWNRNSYLFIRVRSNQFYSNLKFYYSLTHTQLCRWAAILERKAYDIRWVSARWIYTETIAIILGDKYEVCISIRWWKSCHTRHCQWFGNNTGYQSYYGEWFLCTSSCHTSPTLNSLKLLNKINAKIKSRRINLDNFSSVITIRIN